MDENEKQLMQALEQQERLNLNDCVFKAKGDSADRLASKAQIIEALKTVSDPEILISVYDLGLIYDITQRENGDIAIDMTLTTPMCPVAGDLPQQVADALAKLSGTNNIEIKIVWEPTWTPERMSEEAKAMLDMF